MRTITELKYDPRMMVTDDLVISKYNTRYDRIDASLVEALKKSISERGYDENFPLLVAYIGDSKIAEVIGGAHRLTASKAIGIKELPANVYEGIVSDEAIAISYSNNQNQQTFKPETFMDMAYQIHRIHEEGKSLEVIGGMFGMSAPNISYYNAIVNKLDPELLVLIDGSMLNGFQDSFNNNQDSSFNEKLNVFKNVDWKFSWFQSITPLSYKYQQLIIDKIIVNVNRTGKQIIAWSSLFKGRQYLETYFIEHLPEEFLESYIANLDDGTYDKQVTYDKEAKEYKISESLLRTIEELKERSKSRFENMDCLAFIPTLQDASIDVFITDPPYGIEFISNRL